MSKSIAKFTFHGKTYPISINWTMAYNTLPEKFGIELLKLFVDNQTTQDIAQKVLVDDSLTLNLCWFFIEPHVSFEFEKFLELLDEEPEGIDNFREVFWGAVVNFSSAHKRGMLKEIWDLLKKEMKQLSLASVLSSELHSNSNPEESTSPERPSEKSST